MSRSRERRTLSRRDALKCGVASAILWPTCLQARGALREELSLVIVTDTHLGYRDQDSAAKLWQKTAAEINQAPGNLVLHLGDIVDGGREEQYPIYLESRRLIEKPIHEIAGNHDPEDLFVRYIRETSSIVVEHGWLRLLLLNNARQESHDGFISEEQLAWLNSECQQADHDDCFVGICMHVPAHPNLHPDRGWYVKPGSGHDEFNELLGRFEHRIMAVMHGHFHNGIRGWNDRHGVHEICFPSALYNQNRGLEEKSAAGFNPLEFRAGYTLVNIRGGAMTLQYKPTGSELSVEKQCLFGKASITDADRDADGILSHTVRSPRQRSATEIRVLLPDDLDATKRYPVLYVLPVEAARGSRYGDGLSEVRRHGLHNRFQLICVAPTFADLPWYADHPTDERLRQEGYLLRDVVPHVDANYPVVSEARGRLLVGFSKSGWGAFSLLLRNPQVFSKAAAWDAPLNMQAPDKYGMGPIFGTQENFERYQITRLLQKRADKLQAETRLFHLGYDNFREHHEAVDALLTAQNISHVYRDGPKRKHIWESGWLPEAVELLVAGNIP